MNYIEKSISNFVDKWEKDDPREEIISLDRDVALYEIEKAIFDDKGDYKHCIFDHDIDLIEYKLRLDFTWAGLEEQYYLKTREWAKERRLEHESYMRAVI